MKLLQYIIRKGGVHKCLWDALHNFGSFKNLLIIKRLHKIDCALQYFLTFSRDDQKNNKNLPAD